ncbi:glycerol-3-phosphate 1-O-acyltransferase PlsY [Candidatus Pandoraea novymonadis]|uniref:Glycerol-3-phosphate acyltransferase n=1 Tax=Candidatus Pandoraea novymonadis TaxID=1808959 RepID=A0ABX5FFR5_9BURK|nr:glycerol-3-phosphate 1-O-acyltransferase PlsY [Candidatus Pandoraea novymonadis]PSB91892.1 putative glycerol-3-phosphate acyltransferase [Candidatus Pandoraea novymonadis]
MATLFFILISYLLGSVPFAVIVSRTMGLRDPRSYGSGNPGATNVLRSGNKIAAFFTLIGDAFKGWLAVFLAECFADFFGVGNFGLSAVALAVFIGHLYPIFLRFKGGKGVATAAGVLFAISPVVGFVVMAVWLIIAVWFRYSSLAALVSAVLAPVFYVLIFGTGPYMISAIFMAILLVYCHRGNITKLLTGKESRID